MKIIVNGCPVSTDETHLSYEAIVKLAGKSGHPSVTYRAPAVGDSRREGTMYTGKAPLELAEGMVINAMHTGNA